MTNGFFESEKSVCCECGRETLKSFRFCPWCGEATNKDREIENFARHVQSIKEEEIRKKINLTTRRLECLEEELNVMVLEAQLAR